MREYIFYVLLAFLPIGAFMVRILHNQGLPTKNIAFIVLTSLGIVVTFPISMERLGVFLAFTTYAIILSLVILYMVKVEDDMYLETNNTTTQPKVPTEDNDLSTVQDKGNASNMFLEIVATNIIENQVDSISLEKNKDISLNNILEEIKSDESTINNNFIEPLDENIANNTEMNLKDLIPEIDTDIKLVSKENATQEEIKVDDVALDSADITSEMVEESVNLVDIMVEDNTEKIIQVESIEPEVNEREDIASYIEAAFQYKIDGNNNKAIEQFLLIWENSKDYELKYLVTLEMVEMYKSEGLYKLAKELLTKYYEEIQGLNNHITFEINKELKFITLLLNEISRLGLEKAPLAELPRWVKIKVAEELNQLH